MTDSCSHCNCSGAPTQPQSPALSTSSAINNDNEEIIVLKVLTINWKATNVEDFMAPAFEAAKGGKVKIDVSASADITDLGILFSEIENDARLGLELFDVYVTPPLVLGSVVQYDGFADMTDYITKNYLSEWLDIFQGYRDIISTYNKKILMMPFDGDLLYLFYNKEVLEYYDLRAPRTWGEYNIIAEKVHGEIFPATGKPLIGSCIGRLPQCAGPYWAHLVLSSMTQTKGTFEGSLFDTKDMAHLTGEALLETLEIFEKQIKYGLGREEFDGCFNGINIDSMAQDQCVLTYGWGNPFLANPIPGSLGIAKTPGSERVLDRESGKLVPCDLERCPYATYYEDIGFVNHVPYAAFGGWSGAVSSSISKSKQLLGMEFLAFAASKAESKKLVIPNMTSSVVSAGFDPFRKSHIDIDAFIARGYDAETTKSYLATVTESLQSINLATDIRFPEATKIMGALDANIIKHLNETFDQSDVDIMASKRVETLNAINSEWESIMTKYNSRGDTVMPILEQYQRLRGVFTSNNENLNQIENIRAVGWSLGGFIIAMAIGFAVWVEMNKTQRVIRSSQPFFLFFLCFGVVILASSIFPLGIDDSLVDTQGCNIACASVPWLLSTGFTVIFSALFSKLWRINRVLTAATAMRRVVVTEKDVILPFASLMTLNVIILLSWTLVDPLRWNRVQIDELNSYGRCAAEGSAWKAFLSLLIILNFFALFIANVQAYIARGIVDELSESKYIGLSMLSMMQIFIIGIPLLIMVYDNPSAHFFVWTGIIFIVCSSILLLIFVPKVFNMRQSQRDSQRNLASRRNSQWTRNTQQTGRGSDVAMNFSSQRRTSTQRSGGASSVVTSTGESGLQFDHEKLKQLVLEKHHVDITPLISSIQGGHPIVGDQTREGMAAKDRLEKKQEEDDGIDCKDVLDCARIDMTTLGSGNF